jgi:copper(I)-binding protein
MMTTTLWFVARFPKGGSVTRSHRRLAAPAVAGALAVATGLLAACSAGQLAATSLVVPAVAGGQASVQAGSRTETIGIANATLDYPGTKGYAKGDSAAVTLWIFNNTTKDITLIGASSDAGRVLVSTGNHSGAVSPCLASARPIQPNPSTGAPTAGVLPSAGASAGVSPAGPTNTPSSRPSARPTASGTPSAAPSASASASPSPSPSATPAGSAEIKVPIKAFGCVALNRDSAQFLQITQLAKGVGSGNTVNMSFTFSQAGGATYSVAPFAVPVNVPASAGSRPAPQVTSSGE